MSFSDPIYLLLLIPALAWLAWVSRGIHGMTRGRRRLVIGARALLIVLLVCALAGLQSVRPNKGVATVFILDRSSSISAQESVSEEDFIQKSLEAQGPDDQAGLVVFGKDSVIDVNTGSLRTLGRIYSRPDASATDLAGAIRLASATLPTGTAKRLVLLTDGNETTGDAAEAAAAAQADGIQIDYMPPGETNRGGEVVLTDLAMPTSVTKGQPFNLRITAEATEPAEGFLRLDRDGQPVARVPVRLSKGVNSLVVSQTAGGPGFYRYRAVLETNNDTDPRNNTGLGYLSVKGRPRVLVISGTPQGGQALARALSQYDLDVAQGGAEKLPTDAEDLQGFDCVLLSDFPAASMTDRQMALIASSVRESGIGFGMIGGENSFLPGGYYQTPIADALPVDLNVRERKTFPSTTIVIVADTSGSMGMVEDGEMKVKIAATAASAVVNSMSANDNVGVAGSTDEIAFVAPIQKAVNKSAIDAQVGRLDVGGGGIYIEPSLEFAYKALSHVNTRVRHLILLSDGNDAEQQDGALDMARRMVGEHMTVSVVAIGDGKDVEFLKTLASVGRGSFYLALRAHQLQRLMTRDSSLNSRSAIEEGAFLPKVDPGDEALRGLNLASMPPLYAYDVTSDRPLARTPMRTGKNDPLLAFWQYGLGTSLAFTSDAQPKWARPWMGWSDFSAFWAQSVRSVLRQASSNNIQVTTRREDGRGVVEINASDPAGNSINGLPAKVNVLGPDGKAQDVTISQQGPGRYEGRFDAPSPGGYVVSVAEPGASGAQPRITRAGFSIAYPPEYQALRANTSLLARIAQTAGGKVAGLVNPIDSFRTSGNPGVSVRDLWPLLLLLSAILLVLDIAARRLALPFGEMWAGMMRRVRVPSRTIRRAAPAAPVMDRLQQAKRSATPGTEARDSSALLDTLRTPRAKESNAPSGGLGKAVPEAEPSQAPESAREEKTPVRAASSTTAERLLEAKRSRDGQRKP